MGQLKLKDGHVDLACGLVVRGEQQGQLRPKELALLSALTLEPGRPLTRALLYERIWGYHPKTQSRTLDTTVRRLRSAIEQDPRTPALILSVPGIGYRWAGAFGMPPEMDDLRQEHDLVKQAVMELLAHHDVASIRSWLSRDPISTLGRVQAGAVAIARAKEVVGELSPAALGVIGAFPGAFHGQDGLMLAEARGVGIAYLDAIERLVSEEWIGQDGDWLRPSLALALPCSSPDVTWVARLFETLHPVLGPISPLAARRLLAYAPLLERVPPARWTSVLRLAVAHARIESGQDAPLAHLHLDVPLEYALYWYEQSSSMNELPLKTEGMPLAIAGPLNVLSLRRQESHRVGPIDDAAPWPLPDPFLDAGSLSWWYAMLSDLAHQRMQMDDATGFALSALAYARDHKRLRNMAYLCLAGIEIRKEAFELATHRFEQVVSSETVGMRGLMIQARARYQQVFHLILLATECEVIGAAWEEARLAAVDHLGTMAQFEYFRRWEAMICLDLGDLEQAKATIFELAQSFGLDCKWLRQLMAMEAMLAGRYEEALDLVRSGDVRLLALRVAGRDEEAMATYFFDDVDALDAVELLLLADLIPGAVHALQNRLWKDDSWLKMRDLQLAFHSKKPLPAPHVYEPTGVERHASVRLLRTVLSAAQ